MAKYKLTFDDPDQVLINCIPAQPEEGYEEGTEVDINVKFGPYGNDFRCIEGSDSEIIDKAVYHVVMDADKNIILNSDEPRPETPNIIQDLPATAEYNPEVGLTLTILAEVSDGGALSYQWIKGSLVIEGAIDTSYSVTSAGNYKVVITNTIGSGKSTATSTVCHVTSVIPPTPEAETPNIVTDTPAEASGTTQVTLTIVAEVSDGGTLSYQWYKDSEPISGATSNTYIAEESGSYSCTVTNTLGEDIAIATSTTCLVSITGLPKVETPMFEPVAGEVESGTAVVILCDTEGSVIHYTTDGTIPTVDSTIYETPINITEDVTIKAIAVKSEYTDSDVASASYTVLEVPLMRYRGWLIDEDDARDPNYEVNKDRILGMENLITDTIGSCDSPIPTIYVCGEGVAEISGHVVWCYPKAYGECTQYIDDNGTHAIGNTFTKFELVIDDNEYIAYVATLPISDDVGIEYPNRFVQ